MSDFMKNVVAEALRGTKPISKKEPAPETSSPKTLHQLKRPNYQQRNVEKRLSVLNQQSKPSEPAQPVKSNSIGEGVSSLRKMALPEVRKTETYLPRAQPMTFEKAQLIGAVKDGPTVAFFPSVHPSLADQFNRASTGLSVISVHALCCYPSQLVLLNNLLNAHPDLKYHLIWSKENKEFFRLELYGSNTNQLEKLAKDIYQQLTKCSLKTLDSYLIHAPSAWLSKQLGITKSVDTAGILEGLSHQHSLLVLDHYFKDGNNPNTSFQIEKNYLLIFGKEQQVKEILSALKKVADRLA